MIERDFSLGRLANLVFTKLPNMKFRDREKKTHFASASNTCARQLTYKGLGYEPSNPTDTIGEYRMKFGSWIEAGLQYDLFGKAAPFGVINLGKQNDTGEKGTFYGTSWNGYRDQDIAIKAKDGKFKPAIVEIKTKIGYGALATIKKTPYSKEFIVPEVPNDWGYANQLGLYLRDAYNKSKLSPHFSNPIVDGILLIVLFADGLAGLLEFYCEYLPESDSVRFYRVHCEEYPECSAEINTIIDLKPIANHWRKVDSYLDKNELAPPDYERKYSVYDERVNEATKTDLTLASKNKLLIGDVKCKYCSYKDKCAEDLKITLSYNEEELAVINNILKSKGNSVLSVGKIPLSCLVVKNY